MFRQKSITCAIVGLARENGYTYAMNTPAMTIDEALRLTGCRSRYQLAHRLGIIRSSMQKWDPKRIPNERRLQILAGELAPLKERSLSDKDAHQVKRTFARGCRKNGVVAQAQRYGVSTRTINRIVSQCAVVPPSP